MKKIILLVLTTFLIMMGCTQKRYKADESSFSVVEIDSCEYIKWSKSYGFQHKGNCKFCAERRREELDNLAIKIWEGLK